MYLHKRLYLPLAEIDDGPWQALLRRHAFWSRQGVRLDAEHHDIAFHILMTEGELADRLKPGTTETEFDAVPIPSGAFADPALARQAREWAAMHAVNYGAGTVTKMGLYVIRAGGTLGFHVDGPVFLKGARADLSAEHLQRGLMEVQASHRTVLPLRFNHDDSFMICGYRAPLARGELFEFGNVLPHAYFNRGPEHAVLLVTTYLEEDLLPQEYSYGGTAAA
jgi:hypothetical protein